MWGKRSPLLTQNYWHKKYSWREFTLKKILYFSSILKFLKNFEHFFNIIIQVYFRFICNALFIFLLFTLLFHYWRNTRVRNSKQKYFFLILFFISSKYRNIKQNVFETGTLECIKIFRLITHLCRCTLSVDLNTFYFRKYPREFIFPKSN